LLAEDDPESLKGALAGDSLEDAFVELTTGGAHGADRSSASQTVVTDDRTHGR